MPLVVWTQCPSGSLLSVPGTGASGKSKSIHGKDAQHPHTTESQALSPLLPVPVIFLLLDSFILHRRSFLSTDQWQHRGDSVSH